jgi:hypothetical protein
VAGPAGAQEIPGLDRLRSAVRTRASAPYLLTVTRDGRPHSAPATVTWEDELAVTPVPRTWAAAAAAGFCHVTLLWPPAEPGGYSLIADGAAVCRPAGAGLALVVTVTRAVLHRRGASPAGDGSADGGSADKNSAGGGSVPSGPVGDGPVPSGPVGDGPVGDGAACGADCVPLVG